MRWCGRRFLAAAALLITGAQLRLLAGRTPRTGTALSGSLEHLDLGAALRRHAEFLASQRGVQLTQGDNQTVFVDCKAPKTDGWFLPAVSEPTAACPCDPTRFDFTDATDDACTTWMADTRNWERLRPLDSVLMDARTLKFRVTFRSTPAVRAVIKLPQLRFKFEPYAELMGYHVDRLMGFRRVPPTTWVELPVNWLRASAAVSMPPFYAHWLEGFTLNATGLRHLVYTSKGQSVIGVSLQLWMDGVRRLRKTPLQPPRGHSLYLDPGSKARWPPRGTLAAWSLAELTDMYVFDHIIGNNDRTVKKNSFAVGDCESAGWSCDDDPSARPRMVYLDQGSAFYHLRPGRSSHFKQNSTVCRFRRRTVEAARSFASRRRGDGPSLAKALRARLPANHWWAPRYLARLWQPQGAQQRTDSFVDFADRCLRRFTEAKVFPFDD